MPGPFGAVYLEQAPRDGAVARVEAELEVLVDVQRALSEHLQSVSSMHMYTANYYV